MKITVNGGGTTQIFEYSHPTLLSSVLADAGMTIEKPCGGKGHCGKCRIVTTGAISPISEQEQRLLSMVEISAGMRLACETRALGDANINIVASDTKRKILVGGAKPEFGRASWGDGYGLAVDIGTTTVASYLYELEFGECIAECAMLNPQSAFGADVVSRIEYSLAGGREALQRAITGCIDVLFKQLCNLAKFGRESVSCAVLTGNTTMLYLLCGEKVDALATAPFLPSRLFGEFVSPGAMGLELPASAKVYLPRCISAFVGADITSGIIASELYDTNYPTLLVDIGTNGEMVLAADGQMLCCSTAAGPALEAVGITMGSGAVNGAISIVELQGSSIVCKTIGNAPATSICGSGLVDAVAVLLELGAIDDTGRIDKSLAEKSGIFTTYNGEPSLKLTDNVLLTQKDIRATQLAKAAICSGMYALLNRAGISVQAVAKLMIAGAFGNFMNVKNAARIGLIIPDLVPKACSIGNAAGIGATMLLNSYQLLRQSETLAQKAETVVLSTDLFFKEKFIDCMGFAADID